MKKILSFSIILLIIILQIIVIPSKVKADDIMGSADEFLKEGQDAMHGGNGETGIDEPKLKIANATIFNTLFAIGTVLTVIIGGILGIKFMLASAEDKAQIKEMMIPYIVGCVVIFGAFTIWKIAVSVLQDI